MLFKIFGVGALLASTIAVGTMVATPAQAVSIAGSVGFDGQLDLNETDPTAPIFQNFRNFADIDVDGIFVGFVPTEVKDLALTNVGRNTFQAGAVAEWKVYTKFGDGNTVLDRIFFDLDPGATWTRNVTDLGGVSYTNGPGYTGRYRRESDGVQFLGAGFLNLSRTANGDGVFVSQFEITQDAAPIPTPALLPGLVGLGMAALRRRNQEDAEEAEA